MRRTGKPSVRPTARGWQALVLGIVVLAAAIILGTTQLYQLAYALLGLLAAASVLGWTGSRRLSLERRMPPREGFVAGETVTIGLRLANASRLAAPEVEVVDHTPDRRVLEPQYVPAGGERLVESGVSFARRGLYGIGPAEIRSRDPFGLLRFRRDAGQRAEAMVYPEVHDLPGLPVPGAGEAAGRSRPAGQGEDLAGLREYRQGDDRRLIHWKSVARTGELVVKEFDPDAPRRYTVMLDLSGGRRTAPRELDDAVSAAASVVARLDGAGLPYRLRLADRAASSTPFGAGEDAYRQAMRLLATAEADGGEETGTDEVLGREVSEGRLGEGVILVQRDAARPEGLARAVREVSSRGIPVVVILLASHTYAARSNDSEAGLAGSVSRLEDSGAAVRVVREKTGVSGLSALPRGVAGGGARERG